MEPDNDDAGRKVYGSNLDGQDNGVKPGNKESVLNALAYALPVELFDDGGQYDGEASSLAGYCDIDAGSGAGAAPDDCEQPIRPYRTLRRATLYHSAFYRMDGTAVLPSHFANAERKYVTVFDHSVCPSP